jgi:hypothetical protein
MTEIVPLQPKGKLNNTIYEFHDPHEYRTVRAYSTGGILQMDIAEFKNFWDRILGLETHQKLELNDHALIAIDVYSRVGWGVSLSDTKNPTIKDGILRILEAFRGTLREPDWKPDIISGDWQIIHAMTKYSKKGYSMQPEFVGIEIYQTTPLELNKNAIVERFIRIIKWYIIKLLGDPNLQLMPKVYSNFTNQLVQMACIIQNQRYHRMIKEVPLNVLLEFDSNTQKIVHLSYPLLPVGTMVRLRSAAYKVGSSLVNKIFHYDFNLYAIIGHYRRKYILRELFAYIMIGPGLNADEKPSKVGRKSVTRVYQPYEVKEFDSK